MKLIALSVACVLSFGAGCAEHASTVLHPEVQRGSAAQPGKVIVLSAQCGSVERRCPDSYSAAVDEIVRSNLEFGGYALIDPTTLQDGTRDRHEVRESTDVNEKTEAKTSHDTFGVRTGGTTGSGQTWRVTEKKTVVLDGPTFDDLSIEARRSVIARSGADSILTTRIVVGANAGVWSPDQNVEVQVRLGQGPDDTMLWASRCTASSNDFATVNAALESATRCAMMGATGK